MISGKLTNAMIWVNEEINPVQPVLLIAIIETTKGIVQGADWVKHIYAVVGQGGVSRSVLLEADLIILI